MFFKKHFNTFFYDSLVTWLGSLVMAIGISLFLLPNKLSTGGISGISTILFYLFNLPVSITIFLINLPLFIAGMFNMGKYFLFKSILGTVFLSIFVEYFNKFPAITDDCFLSCISGGILVGIGTSLLLKVNASTGRHRID